jgi:guanylate kinase
MTPVAPTDRIQELQWQFADVPSRVVVISGPSAGAGKGKVIQQLKALDPENLWQSASMTTRARRADDHHQYLFVTREEFDAAEADGKMLEANGVTEGNRYGTPLQPILEHLRLGNTVILEIEINGARFVHQVLPEALYLYIKPSDGSIEDDLAVLKQRLEGRGTNDEASIQRRLGQARFELEAAAKADFYDERIINATGKSEAAAARILDLIRAKYYAHGKHGS